MSAITHSVHVTLRDGGIWHRADLWADGDGREVDGFVTSLSQLRDELKEHLTEDHVDLYYVTLEGKSQKIRSDELLKEAVENLPSEGMLSLTAIRRYPSAPHAGNVRLEAPGASNSCPGSAESPSLSRGGKKKVSFSARTIESNDEIVQAIVKRFDAAPFEECAYCENSGSYLNVLNSELKICAPYYLNLSSEEKKKWIYRSAWKTTVPEAPLSRGDESDEVRHLQYLLTRLGLITLSATSKVVGIYDSNTADAVRQFREMYNIVGGNSGEYNMKTAKALGEAIRQLRKDGHGYL